MIGLPYCYIVLELSHFDSLSIGDLCIVAQAIEPCQRTKADAVGLSDVVEALTVAHRVQHYISFPGLALTLDEDHLALFELRVVWYIVIMAQAICRDQE